MVLFGRLRSLCHAAGLPALDVGKHFIPVALPLGHDKAFGAKFRWRFWVDNMVLLGRLRSRVYGQLFPPSE
jgi:hypothetical protein